MWVIWYDSFDETLIRDTKRLPDTQSLRHKNTACNDGQCLVCNWPIISGYSIAYNFFFFFFMHVSIMMLVTPFREIFFGKLEESFIVYGETIWWQKREKRGSKSSNRISVTDIDNFSKAEPSIHMILSVLIWRWILPNIKKLKILVIIALSVKFWTGQCSEYLTLSSRIACHLTSFQEVGLVSVTRIESKLAGQSWKMSSGHYPWQFWFVWPTLTTD